MGYKVESDFLHKEYRCVVIMGSCGYRCGYVGIPKEHPLHGVDYCDKVDCLKSSEMPDIPMDKAGLGQMLRGLVGEYQKKSISPEMFFSVHGGITYSGGGEYPVESDGLWWFGYDCAHFGDGKDIEAIESPAAKEIEMQFPSCGIIRTNKYCEQECKNLAEQLAAVSCGKVGATWAKK